MDIKWHLFIFGVILTVSGVSAAGKCIQCDSTDEKCKTDPASFTSLTDCAAECFTLVENDGKIKRGCVSDTGEKCTGKNCKKCTAADAACNNKANPLTCKLCKSSEDANCAYWKTPDSVQQEICDDSITTCRMEITDDKHTSRRCTTKDDKECPSGIKCKTCTGSGCNTGVFPDNRRKCVQCKSTDSKCASPSTDMSSACLLYEESDKCYEYGSSDTEMARGCKSDTTDYQTCSTQSPKEKCKECDTDSCNVDKYKVVSKVKCMQCTSDDAKCAENQPTEKLAECKNTIEYWKPQGCYINTIEGGKVARGCIQDYDCATNSATCSSCTTDGCNSAQKDSLFCYKCRNDETKTCADAYTENAYKSEPCRNSTTYGTELKQCYVEISNGNLVIRSCLADADEKTRNHCLKADQKTCITCSKDNCNTVKAPNSAFSFALASGLLAASLLVSKFF